LSRWAGGVLLFGLAPVFAWMAWAPLSAAVVASAFVKVDLDRQPVQHAEGGTVCEVKVRDGQRVEKGEALLVLGDVSVDADMNRLSYRVLAERASLSRLEAEQVAARSVSFPADVLAAAQADSRVAEQIVKERSLFDARRDALVGQVALFREQQSKVQQDALDPVGHGDLTARRIGHHALGRRALREGQQDGERAEYQPHRVSLSAAGHRW
jgi:multidrug efflux pump subunit AcrA (membrane-fusion protein)